jgi:hypothetical protein
MLVFVPQMLPPNLYRAAGAAALALVAAAATATVTSAGSVHAASAHIDPCSYLSNAAASVALSVPLSENMQHARVSNDLCVYRAPGGSGPVAFVNVVTGRPSALGRFGEFLRFAGDRSQAIAGVGDAAYTIGPNVFVLRGDTLIVASVGDAGASRSTLRKASIGLARSAVNSWIAINSTCGKDSARVREAAH